MAVLENAAVAPSHFHWFKNVHPGEAFLAWSECVSVMFQEPAPVLQLLQKNANLHSWSVISLLLSPPCCLPARLVRGDLFSISVL